MVNSIIYYKHLLDQAKIILTWQLISSILIILQKLLKYFNGTLVLTFLVLFSVLPAISFSNLNEALLLLLVGKSVEAPLSKTDSSLF